MVMKTPDPSFPSFDSSSWWRAAEEPLEKKIGKKILHPGSHGSTHWYIDQQGQVQYGDRPSAGPIPIPKADHSKHVSPEEHVFDLLHLMGNKDANQLKEKPATTNIILRRHVLEGMQNRGYSLEEAKDAWDKAMAHLLFNGVGYKTVNWNKDTLDAFLRTWLHEHGVKPGYEAEALVHLGNDKWEKVAADIAHEEIGYSFDKEKNAADAAQFKKQVMERIMELRYGLLYEETPEGPAATQNALPGTSDDELPWTPNDAAKARAIHEAILATDRFNDVPKYLLPLALGVDPEIGPLIMHGGRKARLLLEPLYKHNVNLLAASNLAAMSHSEAFGTPEEMKMLWEMIQKKGDAVEGLDPLTSLDIKDYLEDKYGYKPLYRDIGHQKSAWETVSHALSRAGMDDLAEAIDKAWTKPPTVVQPTGDHPLSADIAPGDQDDGVALFSDFNSEIENLDYDGGGPSDDDISDLQEQYFDHHYDHLLGEAVTDYKRDHPEEYDEILTRLADGYADENLNVENYLEDAGGDEDQAQALMMVDAQNAVESDAEDEFDTLAREEVDDDVRTQADEAAWDEARDELLNNGDGDLADDVKAKIDVMNNISRLMEDEHGITRTMCRAFFSEVGNSPDDEHTKHSVRDDYIAGAAAFLIGAWAGSSDGHNEVSNAMQILSSEVFPGVPRWDEKPEHTPSDSFMKGQEFATNDDFRAIAIPFMKSMYDTTQKAFKDAGVTHIVITRGMQSGHGDEIEVAINQGLDALANDPETSGQPAFITGVHPVVDNPLSSWSWHASTAESFASNSSVVFVAKVPVERVVGTFRTGYGCMEEQEAVVMGGGGVARWYYNKGLSRPQMVERAMSGRPLEPQPIVAKETDFRLKHTYKPGIVYDANAGKTVRGVMGPNEESHNKASQEYNKNFLIKLADATVKAEQMLKDAKIDKNDQITNNLSDLIMKVADGESVFPSSAQYALKNAGATEEQSKKLYDTLVGNQGLGKTKEEQIHRLSKIGGISKEAAEAAHQALQTYMQAPPSVQGNDTYTGQLIMDLNKYEGLAPHQAAAIVQHIQGNPQFFKSAALEGSPRLHKALSWTQALARRVVGY